jgi:hypothetical protein
MILMLRPLVMRILVRLMVRSILLLVLVIRPPRSVACTSFLAAAAARTVRAALAAVGRTLTLVQASVIIRLAAVWKTYAAAAFVVSIALNPTAAQAQLQAAALACHAAVTFLVTCV